MDSTDHYSVKLIFHVHLRDYSLMHTNSSVQPLADTNRQFCTTAKAALFQGIYNVQSVQGIFYIRIIIKKYTWTMYSTISKIIPAQKITVNLVVLNLVVKMHNGRSRNYYKVGFNFRLEMIRLKLAKFRLNIPIGNWAQNIPAALSEI